MALTRFWFEFVAGAAPLSLTAGCGVTAVSHSDAEQLIAEEFGRPLPPVRSVIPDIDISMLDANHVAPNMGPPNERGIWYPIVGHA